MKKYTLWFLISASMVAGCGQTGPLYLPEAESQEKPEKDSEEQRKQSHSSAQPS